MLFRGMSYQKTSHLGTGALREACALVFELRCAYCRLKESEMLLSAWKTQIRMS